MSALLNTITEGDCLEAMGSMPAGSVSCVLTDPPFSSGTRREASKGLRKSMDRTTEADAWFTTDSLTTNGFTHLMRCCALEWHRLLIPGGHALVFIDWRMMPALAAAIESADFRHVGLLVWDKTYFGMGHYFRNQHELILHFTKGRSLPPQRRDVGNVLRCPPIRGGLHPTEKPVKLLRDLISVVTPPDGAVLDCFSGVGSTAVAALEEGRSFVCIERDAHFATLSRERVAKWYADRAAPLFAQPPESLQEAAV